MNRGRKKKGRNTSYSETGLESCSSKNRHSRNGKNQLSFVQAFSSFKKVKEAGREEKNLGEGGEGVEPQNGLVAVESGQTSEHFRQNLADALKGEVEEGELFYGRGEGKKKVSKR